MTARDDGTNCICETMYCDRQCEIDALTQQLADASTEAASAHVIITAQDGEIETLERRVREQDEGWRVCRQSLWAADERIAQLEADVKEFEKFLRLECGKDLYDKWRCQ